MKLTGPLPVVALAIGVVLASCSSGTTSQGGVGQGITVAVSPSTVGVAPNEDVGFNAAVYGTADSRVVWAVDEPDGGTIDQAGRYTAPASAGTYHVVARSAAERTATAVATITVSASSPGGGGRSDPTSGGEGVGTGTPSEVGSGIQYFASPTGGGSTCSSESPCSLSGARAKVAEMARPLTEQVIVTLRQGDYTESLSFDESDSGTDATHRVVWRADPAAPAGSVRLLGGTRLTTWTALTSSDLPPGVSWSRIHPTARNGSGSHLFFADLNAHGVSDYPRSFDDDGRRNCELDAVPGQSYGLNCPSGPTLELYVSKVPRAYSCPAGRQCPVPAILARYPNVESDGRNSWATDWSEANYPNVLESPEPYVNHFANVPYRTFSEAGDWESSNGAYLFNVLEELDAPGEYWIDRENGFAYLWPLVPDTDPSANGGEVIVGTTAGPILAFGPDSHHVEVRTVVIEGGQTDCVSMDGTSNTLAFSTVRNCGSNVVTMAGSDHVVDHNRLYNSGNDTIACSASAARVTNNEISEYGRLRTSTVAALRVGAEGIYFAHNVVHDGPSYALYLGRAGLVMEYNDLSRLPLDGSDNGMVYAWASRESHLGGTIRYNYFHDAPRSQTPENWGSAAVYFDARIDDVATYGNVFYCIGECAGPGITWRVGCISKGTNTYYNNVFVDLDPDQGGQILNGSDGNIGDYVAEGNLFIRSGPNGSNGTDYSELPQDGTAGFVCEGCARRDLSNGDGLFSSSAFTVDPNGLSYIPWSSVGIRP